MIITCYILLCVAQASLFVFCMYRSLSLGRAYERELGERYPAVAAKRHAHPFYRMTFPGLPVYGRLTEEAELHDVSLHRKRRAVYCYFVAAIITVCVPPLIALAVRYYAG